MTKVTLIKIFAAIMAGLTLASCASTKDTGMPESEPVYIPVVQQPVYDGAIFTSGTDVALFEDIKAKRIGDILTVLLVEQTSGQNSSDTNMSKATGMGISTPTFGGSQRPNMAVDLNSGHTFTGESGTSQSNRLSGSVTVTIRGVLPGGNLLVEGEKWIQINKGTEYISLSGIVRPRDVGPDNTVYSTQVADARISYSGKGQNSDTNALGWAARVLFSPLWPF